MQTLRLERADVKKLTENLREARTRRRSRINSRKPSRRSFGRLIIQLGEGTDALLAARVEVQVATRVLGLMLRRLESGFEQGLTVVGTLRVGKARSGKAFLRATLAVRASTAPCAVKGVNCVTKAPARWRACLTDVSPQQADRLKLSPTRGGQRRFLRSAKNRSKQ